MTSTLYVPTDSNGIQHLGDHERRWLLPSWLEAAWQPGDLAARAPGEHPLVLLSAGALLEDLDERIFVAVPEPPAPEPFTAARLVAEAGWGVTPAASFALDCAEHVLGTAGGVTLPHGPSLAEVIADARRFLEASQAVDENRLGFVARLAAARRMRRDSDQLGGLALAAADDDLRSGLDALDDPEWATVASLGDAVLAAIEALRQIALPRYTASREATYERDDRSAPPPSPQVITTPWGAAVVGGTAALDYVPAYASARDAAERARLVMTDRGGSSSAADERAWQAERLETYLARHVPPPAPRS